MAGTGNATRRTRRLKRNRQRTSNLALTQDKVGCCRAHHAKPVNALHDKAFKIFRVCCGHFEHEIKLARNRGALDNFFGALNEIIK